MNELLRKTVIGKVSVDVARPFIEKWHYSHRIPTGGNVYFGWYAPGQSWGDLLGDGLYAVANYGIGVNPYQAAFLAELTGKDVEKNNLLELKRLCRVEPKVDRLPLTAFLSRCHKILRKQGIQFIVSFSDPEHGHTGGIYKAANFIHYGKTNPERHLVDADGNIRHRRLAYRYAQRNNCSMVEARHRLGMKIIATEGKDRWFIEI